MHLRNIVKNMCGRWISGATESAGGNFSRSYIDVTTSVFSLTTTVPRDSSGATLVGISGQI
jgi:hypothetical protein